jgi:hypothetical protein
MFTGNYTKVYRTTCDLKLSKGLLGQISVSTDSGWKNR